MMATTHALAGLALAAGVTTAAPELGTLPAVAAAVGGLAPDVDLLGAHRRTLHFPAYASLLAVPAVGVAFVAPGSVTVAAALFVVAAALHAASDVLGPGLELRPWEGTSERAVYDHLRGRWIAPRRLVRYDGAPEDVAVGALLAIPSLVVFDAPITTGVGVALAVSVGYAALRKRLPAIAEWGADALPDGFDEFLPERVRDR
jgi:hypothetical protein